MTVYVYVMNEDSPPDWYIKIGFSRTINGIRDCLRQCQRGNARRLQVVAYYATGHTDGEVRRKLRYRGYFTVRGEWFRWEAFLELDKVMREMGARAVYG